MERLKGNLFIIVVMIGAFASGELFAQGRGHDKGRGNGKGNGYAYGHDKRYGDRDDRKHSRHNDYYDDRSRDSWSQHHHGSRTRYAYPVYVHQHRHDCDHRVVVRYYERPRFVYYRDYDMYFDFHRNVYITYSGRHWTISNEIPQHIHYRDFRDAHCVEVNYYEDDFVDYLDRGRPEYGSIYVRR